MNRDEILAMPAGRKLDAIVAEKVMGFELDRYRPNNAIDRVSNYSHGIKKYTTDISAAWDVMKKLQENFIFIDLFSTSDSYNVIINECDSVNAEEAPEAICKAALINTIGADNP